MRKPELFLKLGGACLLLSGLVFWENPVLDFRSRHPDFLDRLLFLYGFPLGLGVLLLALRPRLFMLKPWLSAALALGALPWLFVWCFLWSRIVALNGPASPLNWQGLFAAQCLGLGLALAGILAGWAARQGLWYLRTLGWVVFLESILNLLLQPGLWFLTFSALGGALILFSTLKQLEQGNANGL
jgi:hypothetical protein